MKCAVGPDMLSAQQVIERYAAVARPLILRYFPPNSCIAAARITIECLRRFGVRASGLAVKLVVKSEARNVWYVIGLDAEEQSRGRNEASNWVDRRVPGGGWNGHVVTIAEAEDTRWLIDASLDQASCPEHGIVLPPWILVAGFKSLVPSERLHAQFQAVTDDGEVLSIEYLPLDDRSFTRKPAWETDHLQGVISEVCARMRTSVHVPRVAEPWNGDPA